MLTHSRRRLLLPVLICLIFLLLLPLISLGEEENSFTVTKDGESSEYDFPIRTLPFPMRKGTVIIFLQIRTFPFTSVRLLRPSAGTRPLTPPSGVWFRPW